MRVLTFTSIRNEGPFLLEWIAYHRLMGVTEFLFFSNDCEDGSDQMLTALAQQGVVRHIPHRAPPGKSVQWSALNQVATTKATAGFDWAMFIDVDEFVQVHAGDGTLACAMAALPSEAEAIALPWRLFGASSILRFEDRPVTAQFLRSAPADLSHPIAGRYIKTLYRPDRFQKPGIHRPKHRPGGALPVWCDGSGQRLPDSFAKSDGQIALPGLAPGRQVIELNHYSLRSVESFLVKSARGLPNSKLKAIDLSYWVERNFNTVENTAITRWSARLAREISALRALPGIEALHQGACAWHRARFEQIIQTPAGYRLMCDCLHAAESAALDHGLAMQLYAAYARIAP